MNCKKRLLTGVLCLAALMCCLMILTACGGECDHKWGDWQEKVAATCVNAGESTRACSECGETETKKIDALGHTGGAADCTSGAKCDRCGEIYGSAVDHAWVDANCASPKKCSACGATEGEALAHTGGTATCKEQATCTACGEKYGDTLAHTWVAADCDTPKTCSVCNATEGSVLGHTWVAADCDTPKTCSVCNATEGSVLGHTWANADCETPKTCTVCNATEGSALGHTGGTADCENKAVCTRCNKEYGELGEHSWVGADCDTPKTCSVCNATEGSVLGHTWADANCEAPKTCETCGATEGSALGHAGGEADCENKAECTRCGEEYGELGEHSWIDADCETPKTCETCGTTEGSALGHTGGEADCENKAECTRCGEEYGELGGHPWVDADCENPKYCPVCGETDGEAVGHDGGEATCNAKAVCDTCGASYGDYADHDWQDANCLTPSYCANCPATVGEVGDHAWDGDRDCENGHTCGLCGTTETALGHSYDVMDSGEATCTEAEYYVYECGLCGDSYTEVIGTAKGHDITGVDPVEVGVEGQSCKFVITYKCKECGEDVEGDTVTHHTYKSTLTKEATCCEAGSKTVSCTVCGDSYDEAIEENANGHVWDEGVLVDTTRTYTCVHGCGETRKVYDASAKVETNITAGDLADTSEVQLQNAALGLDSNTLAAIGDKEVTLSAGTLEGDELENAVNSLSPEKKEQLGNNPIYNFSMMDSENKPVLFENGFITVTIPYTLSEGEDIDSIAVWYINGDTVESIPVIYSNGFVTFKTNHFSYYGVTNLDDEARCLVYGHIETKTVVVGSCTRDGYTLISCERCSYTEKVNVVKATGHDHQISNTVAATCTTTGVVTYKCTSCQHSYNTRLAAIGHKFVETESEESTCEKEGFCKYECSNDGCNESYTVTYPKAAHNYEEEIVEPTCDKDGYTIYTCSECGTSYTSDYENAWGHIYSVEVVWSEDFTAKVVFTCGRDSEHTFEKDAKVTSKTIASTCERSGVTTYTATLVYNGAFISDVVEIALDPLDHEFDLENWESDSSSHWHECTACGERTDEAKHGYENENVTKEPTCSESGEVIYTCECGETKKNSLAATGEHNFVDGVCSVCGKEEGTCDHSPVREVFINLDDYAICGMKFYAYSCDCGEYLWASSDVDGKCEFVLDETSYEENDDGSVTISSHAECPICGLNIDYSGTAKFENCIVSLDMVYTVTLDGKVLATIHEYDWEEEHDGEEIVVDLKELGYCGGYVTYYQCSDCDKVYYVDDYEIGCPYDMGVDEVVDEDGVVHFVGKIDCADCGLTFIMEMWEIEGDKCLIENHGKIVLKDGDDIILEIEITEAEQDHYYTVTGEAAEGKICSDGYTKTYTCEHCGDIYHSYVYDHSGWEYGRLEVSDKLPCGGEVFGEYCADCGEITSIENIKLGCSLNEVGTNETVDANGNVHTFITQQCKDCGLFLVSETWSEEINSCITTYYGTVTIIIEGVRIFEYTSCEDYEEHDYDTDIEFVNGVDCSDGVTICETCKICETENTITYYNHYTECVTVDLSEYDGCKGYVEVERCTLCGKDVAMYSMESSCMIKDARPMEVVGEDGITRTVMTATCYVCGLVYTETKWTVQESECYAVNYTQMKIEINGVAVIDLINESLTASHKLEYKYTLWGESCEDGWGATAECSVCGVGFGMSGQGHSYEYVSTDLGELGLCGGHVRSRTCRICGEKGSTEIEEKCHFVDEECDGTLTCINCGVEKKYSQSSTTKDENCCYTEFVSLEYIMNGETVYSLTEEREAYDHNYEYSYELDGENCEDGVWIYKTCLDCKSTDEEYNYGHYEIEHSYDFSEYGACGGYVYASSCPCGKFGGIDYDFGCKMLVSESAYVDGNEVSHSVKTYSCRRCGLVVTFDSYTEQVDCSKITYSVISATINNGETVIIDGLKVRTMMQNTHDFEYEYTMRGETCEYGVEYHAICKKCGSEQSGVAYGHMMSYTETDLGKIGLCGGVLRTGSCKFCDYTSEIMVNDYGCIWKPVDGASKESGVYFCEICGAEKHVTSSRTEKDENCQYIGIESYVYYLNGVEVARVSSERTFTQHDIQESLKLLGKTCEEGVEISISCKDCEYSDSDIAYHHYTARTEYDLAAYGVCGGVAYESYCACGYEKNFNAEYFNCCFRDEGKAVTDTDTNGVKYTTYTRVCENCGVKVVTIEYSVVENCLKYEHRIYSAYMGDTAIYENVDVLYNYYDYHDYEYTFNKFGATCEEGYSYVGICACGKETSGEDYGHRCQEYVYIYLSEYGLCGGMFDSSTCDICQEMYGYYLDDYNCDWQYNEEASFEGKDVFHCNNCGTTKTVTWEYSTPDENCRYECRTIVVYTKDGAEVLTLEYSYYSEDHSLKYTWDMYGETCEDGYKVYAECVKCDYTETWEGMGHNRLDNKVIDIAELGGCGGTVTYQGCPCGQDYFYARDISCELSSKTEEVTDEHGTHYVYTDYCEKCGFTVLDTFYEEREGCYGYNCHEIEISLNGQNILSLSDRNNGNSYHDWHLEAYLDGESCVDGYTLVWTCTVCPYTQESKEDGHLINYRETEYDLAKYGACGGTITVSECPCGERCKIERNLYCQNREYSSSSFVDGNGITQERVTYTCTDCGLIEERVSESTLDGCYEYRYNVYNFRIGNDYIVSGVSVVDNEGYKHDYSYTFEKYGEVCEDGVKVTGTCGRCGESYDNEIFWHESYMVEKIDLTQYGACSGYAIKYECPCGKDTSARAEDTCVDQVINDDWTDDDGNYHNVKKHVCNECGLELTNESFRTRDAETCSEAYVYKYTISVDDTVIFANEYKEYSGCDWHDYEKSVQLKDGATSCEEGVAVTYTCKDCGEFYSDSTIEHTQVVLNTYYFNDYGSLCGGYAEEVSCACGQSHDVNFPVEGCDFEEIYGNCWVEGVLDGTQYIPNGQEYVNSFGIVYSCAVTEPDACEYVMRKARYYLADESGCTATQYETWQLGYDAETNTCEYEFTFATGYKMAYHDFVATELDSYTDEDGTRFEGTSCVCSVCGTSWTDCYWINSHNIVKHTNVYDNKIANDMPIFVEQIEEYSYDDQNRRIYEKITYNCTNSDGSAENWVSVIETEYDYSTKYGNGSRTVENMVYADGQIYTKETVCMYLDTGERIEIYSRQDWTYTDGTTSWATAETEYDRTTCMAITTYSGSDIETYQLEIEIHYWVGTYVMGSCSQNSGWKYTCRDCGSTRFEDHGCGGHSFNQSGEIFVCGICGIESETGVNGSVILEDLTAAYGDEDTYVVGYCNYTGAKFENRIVLVLNGGEEKVVLDGISFGDCADARAKTFSMSAVVSAAEALGYTSDMYEVRLVFVSIDPDVDFDYHITFATLEEEA